MNKSINSFRGEYSFLSNFYPCKILWKDEIYYSLEVAYQASKTLDAAEKEYVRCSLSPGQSKKRGRKITLRSDWEDIKLTIMEELLKIKFSDPKLKELLLETSDSELIEGNNWGDTFWGVYNGKGKNHLGKLLMKIRENLK